MKSMNRLGRTAVASALIAMVACSVEYADKRDTSGTSTPSGASSSKKSTTISKAECLKLAAALAENPENCNHPGDKNDGNTVAAAGATPTPGVAPTATPVPGVNLTKRGLLTLAPDKVNNKDVWVYEIQAGTAANTWNTAATVLEMKVGEVLRITTKEAGHGFHVTGTAPCKHGGDRQYDANKALKTFNSVGAIDVGGHFECDIATAVDSSAGNNLVYDHIKGVGARIFFKTIP